GILPGGPRDGVSRYIDLPVYTSMGSARNAINVLSSRVVVACPGSLGTLSEIALALAAGRPVVLLNHDPGPEFLSKAPAHLLARAKTPPEAVARVREFLAQED
ncbi:MAG: DNA-binding protein, partial [Proteobacteria bacterium]|nr:DNA-binding protein [Pseudomonadota bacterium]